MTDLLRMLQSPEHAWWQRALCRKMHDFIAETTVQQQQVCSECPVIGECLAFALDHEPRVFDPKGWPVYGGLTGEERQAILKGRADRKRQAAKEAAEANAAKVQAWATAQTAGDRS